MIDIRRDILIRMNQIQKTDVTVTKKEIKFNVLENEILEWLKDLKKVFETILKRKLSSRRYEVNYEITLRIEKIKSSLLILIRLEKQKIVKKYLNKMTRKE